MNDTTTKPAILKERLAHELRQFLVIGLYLTVFFGVFKWYTRLLLAEYHVAYLAYGYTFLKALALAKIILTGESLRLGERYRQSPLIVPMVFKALVFSVFVCVFEVLEHLLIGSLRGQGLAEIVAEILDRGWSHILAVALVVFVAFLPFFAFRELERVLGDGKLHALFFKWESPGSSL
jgi:hypothetical protein